MQTQINNKNERSKEYLKDCFMQQCRDEYDAYIEDEESALDKYAKLSIKYLQYISLGVSSTLIVLQTPINFNLASALIAISVLVFFISIMLILRYSMKNSENLNLKNEIYDAWTKTILNLILINLFLIFIENGLSQMLVILFFATIAIVYIQKMKKALILE